MRTRFCCLPLLLAITAAAQIGHSQQVSRDREIHDPGTRAWWHTTEQISSDAMEGRDTGSAAYDRAAKYVAERFRQAGLTPAGDNGSYLQQVPLREIEVTAEGTSFTLLRARTPDRSLDFLQQITITPTVSLPPTLEAPLAFRGYCSREETTALTGKIAVCFGARRAGLPSARDRVQAVRAAGAVGIITVDDLAFTIEPPRWPEAYARSVTLASTASRSDPGSFVTMRLSASALPFLIEGTPHDARQILALGGQSKPLASFDLPTRLRLTTRTRERTYSSPNVLALLPGTDPALKFEYIVIAAHLDGYGHGTPVLGDSLYNGTLDDAAYVALLIQFAEDQKTQAVVGDKSNHGLKRSVLLCAFAGEEKGLLGSTWFTQHPTVSRSALAADINLDQLRPLFPLNILTALAVDDTSLGQTARSVAAPLHIEIRPDHEPERNLLLRADHWPFMQIGVPSIGFIFGYDPGTEAERRYREWYTTRYHRPQDDLTQPMDFDAATKFNTFFYTLTRTLADDPTRPSWSPASSYKPVSHAVATRP